MNYSALKLSTLALAIGSLPLAASASDEVSSLSEMVTKSKTSFAFRYRYEFVDQTGIDRDANASTLKSRLTWKSAPYKGFTAGAEVDNVTIIGDERYRTPTNGESSFPIVADPDGTDLNQVYLSYKDEDFTGTVGRQRIVHSGQRFMGGVAWRQNEQTYDALRIQVPSLGPVKLDYSYIWDVNRIFGPDDSLVQPKRWESDSHALLASFAPAEGHDLTFFTYLLDFENALANSSSTFGLEYKGKVGPVSLAAAVASQSDYADNPTDYDAEYYMAELGFKTELATFGIGYEVLGSDEGTAAFRTPLATLHKFQGWADKFLGTPATGIEDVYFKVAGKVGPASLALIYHDFSSDEGGVDFGSEFDVVATYPFNKNVNAQLKYASYDADNFATDTDKLWFSVNLKF